MFIRKYKQIHIIIIFWAGLKNRAIHYIFLLGITAKTHYTVLGYSLL